MAKTAAYRHAGTDVMLSKDAHGDSVVTVNQQYYIDALTVEMSADRLRQPGLKLTPEEVGACRAALGTLQWLAIQTQPQLCARCNLLLTELTKHGLSDVAWELQQMIGEVRRSPSVLRFFKLKKAASWRDVLFISMADQAHSNRPDGDSTGGMVTLIAGPEALQGGVCPMVLLSWKTWRLKRKAISSNDAEVQTVLEAEDHDFRVRLLWSEMHGAGWHRTAQDSQVEWAEQQVEGSSAPTLAEGTMPCRSTRALCSASATLDRPRRQCSFVRTCFARERSCAGWRATTTWATPSPRNVLVVVMA